MIYLGIDVSKLKLDTMLLVDPVKDKRKAKVVANNAQGVKALLQWCTKQGLEPTQIHALIEATGPYHEQAATALHEAGMTVSVLNAANVRDFAKALSVRSKTDTLDSLVLARYGQAIKPPAWQPPTPQVRQLRVLLSQLEALNKDQTRVLNRREKLQASHSLSLVKGSIDNTLRFYASEIARLQQEVDDHIDRHPQLKADSDLLRSIPGVGLKVSQSMLTVMQTHQFGSAEALAAYVGLVPVQHQSGTSVRGQSRLSKAGRADLRAKLYMAGIAACRYNPHVRALYERLLQAGKRKMAALAACMRKLVHLCFGVIKQRTPYRADYLAKT